MTVKNVLRDIEEHIEEVIKRDTPLGRSLWDAFIELHPADIARFLGETHRENAKALFLDQRCVPEER